ncbi:MAG: response regulator [Deltaproteobacteria bacterium]|nr:response regulator [Deltaproteobacteria bacterium]
MRDILQDSKVAIVGGGKVCKAILKIVFGKNFPRKIDILGVADIHEHAEGLVYAKKRGIFTTLDYEDLYRLQGLNLLIELTGDDEILRQIRATKPADVRLIDHFEAMSVWDFLQIEEERQRIKRSLRDHIREPEQIEKQFDLFSRRLAKIVEERTRHLQSVEREIVERERALSQIVQGNTIPTFVINKDHIVTHWNWACEKLTGCKAEEVVGTDKQWCPFRPEKRPIMADVIVDEMEEEEIEKYYGHSWRKSPLIQGAYEAEEFFPHMGDGGKWLFFTAAPIRDANGETVGSIETLWDTTERREAREELQRAHDELEEKTAELEKANVQLKKFDELKSSFIANMSHDLRTPLNSILGYTDLLLDRVDGDITEEQEKSLTKVNNNAKHLLNLINDILDISRIESGRMELDLKPVNVKELIRETVSALDPLLQKKGLELKTAFDEGLPSVHADPDRVRQVVTNLVDNAIKFTPKGHIAVGARASEMGLEDSGAPKFVEVCISDTGKGIRKKDLNRLFDKFRTLDTLASNQHKGTGLGLNICKGLVEIQGGTIWAKSTYRKGTTFYFTLPIEAEAARLDYAEAGREEELKPPKTAAETMVLVVDDEPDQVTLIRKILRQEGYQIESAYDGRQAIEAVKRSRPDLIILDLIMPNVNGFEVIEYLKGGAETKDIPVIVLTGKELSRKQAQDLRGKVERIVKKGVFEMEEILDVVKNALNTFQVA